MQNNTINNEICHKDGAVMNRNHNPSYVVQPGDNLYSIALKFNTSVESIVFLNHLVNPIIYIGQMLSIPGSASKKGMEVRHEA